jgi:putative Mn2+ efflux pump MntP
VESLRLVRNIFIRIFVIGALFGVLFAIATLAGWNLWIPLAARLFHTDTATMTSVTLQFFVGVRFFLWFCVLTPALAMHWTLKAETRSAR